MVSTKISISTDESIKKKGYWMKVYKDKTKEKMNESKEQKNETSMQCDTRLIILFW